MKYLKSLLPNVSIACSVALMIVIYLDLRNPMMGFLSGGPFLVLALLTALSSIATAIVLYRDYRKEGQKKSSGKHLAEESGNGQE